VVVTTNPLRGAKARWAAFERNLERLQRDVARTDGALRIANNYADYLRARADGAHVVLPSIQGANALQAAPAGPASIAGDLIVRATLVHLTNAVYGPTSSPLGLGSRDDGLSSAGFELVEQLDQQRIFVDLAHIGHRAFFDACAAHDPQLPLLATHTGCAGVRPHWRNLNDDQLRAIAATDGVVGIIFQAAFLRRAGGPRDVDMVVEHLTHVRDTIGARAVGVGSDYDGAIVTSADLRDGATGYLRLTDALLRAGWRHDDIIAALGGNFLRALKVMRPGS
jgi:membrane dipeptidase